MIDHKTALSRVTYGVFYDENGDKKVKGFGDKYFKLDPNSVLKQLLHILKLMVTLMFIQVIFLEV